jgi:hypothetical protein
MRIFSTAFNITKFLLDYKFIRGFSFLFGTAGLASSPYLKPAKLLKII